MKGDTLHAIVVGVKSRLLYLRTSSIYYGGYNVPIIRRPGPRCDWDTEAPRSEDGYSAISNSSTEDRVISEDFARGAVGGCFNYVKKVRKRHMGNIQGDILVTLLREGKDYLWQEVRTGSNRSCRDLESHTGYLQPAQLKSSLLRSSPSSGPTTTHGFTLESGSKESEEAHETGRHGEAEWEGSGDTSVRVTSLFWLKFVKNWVSVSFTGTIEIFKSLSGKVSTERNK